ncbi:MAG: PilZ domain-containing protein [Nitrospiraceae bacterium]
MSRQGRTARLRSPDKGGIETVARFIIREYQRFSVQVPAFYWGKDRAGQATVTDFSLGGWRLVGTYPVRQGARLSLRIQMPEDPNPLQIHQALVQWNRGHEFGIEAVNPQPEIQHRLRNWPCLMASRL